MIITIDGPSASGKSSVAKKIANLFGLKYLGTGYVYRAAAFLLYEHHVPTQRLFTYDEITALRSLVYVNNGQDIEILSGGRNLVTCMQRLPEIDRCASLIGADSDVRNQLLEIFRAYCLQFKHPGVVVEGRDCGTVMFPNALIKFFITASPRVRAARILADSNRVCYVGQTLQQVEASLVERDLRDSSRAISPLRPAEDAVFIDNSELSLEQTLALMLNHIHKRMI